jgi:hypothetical protein
VPCLSYANWDCHCSPKVPGAAPDDIDAEEEIGDGVGSHGVAEAVFADDEPLIGCAADDAGEPFIVGKAEEGDGDEKRQGQEPVHGHGEEIWAGDIAIQKGAVEDFLERRHDNGHARDMNEVEKPGESGAGAKNASGVSG